MTKGVKPKPMDLLKSALAERQAKAQKIISETGQKWVRRGVLEEKRQEEYFEEIRMAEERAKAEEEAQLQRFEKHVAQRESKHAALQANGPNAAVLADALLDDDDAEPPLGIVEVIERLREISQPITLFGETDMQRYKRLRQSEKERHEGKTNPDILMLDNVHAGQKFDVGQEGGDDDKEEEREQGDASDKSDSDVEPDAQAADDKSDSEEEPEPAAADDKSDSEAEPDQPSAETLKMIAQANKVRQARDASATAEAAAGEPGAEGQAVAPAAAKPEEDMELDVDVSLMDKCDFIRCWARKALKAWEKELADKPEEDKKTARVKTEIAQHRQVRRDVRPLQRRLRMYRMEEWLLDKIHAIVQKADEREYRDAAEAYLDLSIGKAAWPVGIGCGGSMLMEDAIGLHDRFNRMSNVKDIAFALNDDVTRKFVQALKRLMNVAQRYWPATDPSKASG